MFGDTLSLTINGAARVHVKINQDGYASEYLYRSSTVESRVKIRHSNSNPRNGTRYDRHNVEIVETVFATESTEEFIRKAYFITEQLPSDADTELMEGLAAWATPANLAKLNLWES
jgi:hypothetical protein